MASLTPEQRAAAIRLGRRQRAEQGLTEDITDPLVLDRVATILAAGLRAAQAAEPAEAKAS